MTDDTHSSNASIDSLVAKAFAHVQKIFAGNGVKKESVTLASQSVTLHTVHAATYLELKPVMEERTTPGKSVVGQMVGGREEATKFSNQVMAQLATNPATKAQMAALLLERPDKGFGLKQTALPIPFVKQEYTWHEPCHTCNGSSRMTCPKCMGRRTETCIKCTGRGLMKCPMCRATGLLQGNKCPRCHAQRYVPCDGCKRSGFMNCRTCTATGVIKCTTCNGIGFKTNIMTLSAQAIPYFEYDPKTMPKNAADAIEMSAPALAAQSQIKIKGRIADDKEGALGACYEVSFPCGEMAFRIGSHDVKAQLFGYDAQLTGLPNLLDKMVGESVRTLEEAVAGAGSVADTIQKATRYKIIGQAFLLSQKTSVKKVTAKLLQLYDVGLSPALAEKISTLAYAATSQITRKPRFIGFGMGVGVFTLFMAAYYLLPVRSTLGSFMPHNFIDIVLEIIPIVAGGFFITHMVRRAGAKSVQTALGHLVKDEMKGKLMARAQSLSILAYVASAGVCIVMLELSIVKGDSAPYWYQSLKSVIGI